MNSKEIQTAFGSSDKNRFLRGAIFYARTRIIKVGARVGWIDVDGSGRSVLSRREKQSQRSDENKGKNASYENVIRGSVDARLIAASTLRVFCLAL